MRQDGLVKNRPENSPRQIFFPALVLTSYNMGDEWTFIRYLLFIRMMRFALSTFDLFEVN